MRPGSSTPSRAPLALTLLALTLLAGCERYTPLPLVLQPPLAASLAALELGGIDISRPLHVADVAVLAVRNSPDLAATRRQRGVSQAQVLQAGLLANPSLSGAILPLAAGQAAPNGVGSSSTVAWTAGLSYDIRSLITHASRRREAQANARSVDATLLWQEWQTIAQARLLCTGIIEGDRLLDVLRRLRDLIGGRARVSQVALERGDVTIATAAPDVAALQTARAALYDQERVQLGRRHQLAALLGLTPNVTLLLVAAPDLPVFDPDAVGRALATLPDRRPDLAALRFGYAAEDARLRTAILSQFPNVTIGVSGGSDNSNVRNVGPQISLDLPIFDHAQGQIATERATRLQLQAEYRARLAATVGQVQAMLAEIALLQLQLADLRHDLPGVERIARVAQSASAAGDLDERSALDLIAARFTKEQEIVILEQALLEQQVALATLTGAGLPPLHMQKDGS